MHAEHDDGNLGNQLVKPPGGLETVHLGHTEIEHDQVGNTPLYRFQSVLPACSFLSYPPVSMLLQHVAKPLPDKRVVVDNENADLQAGFSHIPLSLWSSSVTMLAPVIVPNIRDIAAIPGGNNGSALLGVDGPAKTQTICSMSGVSRLPLAKKATKVGKRRRARLAAARCGFCCCGFCR
jgi:hypothetical protein